MTREEAIGVLKKSIDNTIEMTTREWEAFDLELAEAIDMAISALSDDAVQGEWIITKEGEYDGRSVYKTVCSECGHETFYKANKAHFCPNCGARIKNINSSL